VPPPRIIEVSGYGHTVPHALYQSRGYPWYCLASRESYEVSLKHHTLAFGSRLPRAIYFSFTSDSLFFPSIGGVLKAFLGTSTDGIHYNRYANSANAEYKVRHLIVGCP